MPYPIPPLMLPCLHIPLPIVFHYTTKQEPLHIMHIVE